MIFQAHPAKQDAHAAQVKEKAEFTAHCAAISPRRGHCLV